MPGRRRDPDVHRAILAAAEELLNELGYHRVTMDRIAERAGVGKMTLYRWWPNKAAVVTEAVRSKLSPTGTPDAGDVTQDANEQLNALLAVLTAHGGPSVVANAMSTRGEAGRDDLRDILRPWFESIVTILDRAVTRGQLPADFPVEITANKWIGYALYRVVFLQEEVASEQVSMLVSSDIAGAAAGAGG